MLQNRTLVHRQLLVFLLSITLIGLEVIWTRLFSAEFYHPFAFLVLSLAIMGLGLGALALRLVGSLNRPEYLGPLLSITGLSALAGPPLVFLLDLDFAAFVSSWAMVGRLLLTVVMLSGPFFFGGICLAMLFRRNHPEIPRLYMADLVGAGGGVMAAIMLMNVFGTPAATFLCSAPLLVAATLSSRRWIKAVPIALGVLMAVLCVRAGPLLEKERKERGPVIYKHWDAVAKIKVYGYGEEYRSFNIDNLANTGTYGFDGNWDRPEEERFEFGIDVSNLIERFESPTFLSLGAGGGSDVLQALQAGADEIHAVEVNAHMNRMLLEGDPSGYVIPSPEPEWLAEQAEEESEEKAEEDEEDPPPADIGGPERIITMDEFSGHIYSDPRVLVITEDARAYVGRFKNKFDIIYSLSSNTFAALTSGSFAMAENYLFTTEAFRDYWEALSPDGFMMMEHQFYMPRLVGSLIDALDGLGVEAPRSHFAIYDLPKMRRNMMLLSRRPLSPEIIDNAFGPLTAEKYEDIHLLYPAPEDLEDNVINRIVLEGWESAAEDASVDISPVTDDRPFVGQMGLWKNLGAENAEKMRMLEVFGFPLSGIIILVILGVVLLIVLPLNFLPFLTSGDKLRAVPWLYFFVIGVAFMAVEVVLIQKYTLFVGPSAYSISTILLTLLLASGLGSRMAGRFSDWLPFAGIALWLLLDVTVFRHLVYSLAGLSMAQRIMVTALLVAPLGILMGMPFPKGALRVGELVDWGFAVNGAASVLGATGVLLLAFAYGISTALLAAAVLYLIALALFSMRAAWTPLGRA